MSKSGYLSSLHCLSSYLFEPVIVVPGIAFVLIAVRTHIVRKEPGFESTRGRGDLSTPSAGGMLPSWLRDDGDETNRRHDRYRSGTGHLGSIPIMVTTTTEQHRLEVMTPTSNHNIDLKLDRTDDSNQPLKSLRKV